MSGATAVTVVSSGDTEIDTTLYGTKWSTTTLTYSFPTSVGDVSDYASAGPLDSSYFGALTSDQQQMIEGILELWSRVSGLTFTEAAEPGGGDLRIYWYQDGSNLTARVLDFPSDQPEGGDVQLGSAINPGALGTGGYSYFTVLHEIGHALGLKHPHDAVNGFPAAAAAEDSVEVSVMSYRSFRGGPMSGYSILDGSYPYGPMLNDIAALQHLYGANWSTNAGDTVYTFNPATAVILQTLWDGGGTDIYSFASYTTDLSINLEPGAWSDLGGQYAALDGDVLADANLANPYLHEGDPRSLIENARGGSGADTIVGNLADNLLWGNGGADSLVGGDGDDVLSGGAGADTLSGGAGIDTADYGAAGAGVTAGLAGGGGGEAAGDVLSGVENLVGSAHADTLAGDAGANTLYGGGGGDSLVGGAGDDVLSGGDGDDTLAGGAGNDALDGGAGSDTADYGAATAAVVAGLAAGSGGDAAGDTLGGVENLAGSAFADVLTGDGAANRLSGGGGGDRLSGDGGDDTLEGGDGDDTLAGGAGSDSLVGGAGIDTADYAASAAAVATDLATASGGDAAGDTLVGIENVVGSVFADSVTGDGGANLLAGGSGADVLSGGAGADTLDGGADADALDGGADADLVLGGAGNDTLSGGGGADTLSGGAGDDLFLFAAAGDGGDTLADFGAGDAVRVAGHTLVGPVSAGDGTLVAADALQVGTVGGVTTLFIDTDGVADAAELSVTLGGTYGVDSFALSDGAIVYVPPPPPPPPPPQSGGEQGGGDGSTRTETVGGATVRTTLATVGGTPTVSVSITPPTSPTPIAVSLGGTGTGVLNAAVPAGVGLAASGPQNPQNPAEAAQTLTTAVTALAADPAEGATLTAAITAFAATLPAGATLTVRTVTPTVDGAAPGTPLTITGGGAGGEAIVVDARALPAGTILNLDDVGFAVIVGAVQLGGGAGSQHVVGDGAAQRIVLGADDDTLNGGGGDDVVGSEGGDDVLYGDTGFDTVTGGVGADVLYGNQQDDLLYGNQGADTLFGGQDRDTVFGGQDGDLVYGNRGHDALYGNRGGDTLFGGQGDDVLFGGQGDDEL
ncbi:M10 family metallopeptidase C-terminal domain-containing protein, partial [Azospirillum sp. A39]